MIPDILFFIITGVFQAIAFVLGLIPFRFPPSAFNFIGYGLGTLGDFSGVWDVPALITVMGLYLGFELAWMGFLVVNWIVTLIRGIRHG